MRFGPFRQLDLESIKQILNSKKIQFKTYVDHDLEKRLLSEFHQAATTNPRMMAGRLDLSCIYFDIADEDFGKVQIDLEKYGVLPLSDGSFELGDTDSGVESGKDSNKD